MRQILVAAVLMIVGACSAFTTTPFFEPGLNEADQGIIKGGDQDLNSSPQQLLTYFDLSGHGTRKLVTAFVNPGKHCLTAYAESAPKFALIGKTSKEITSREICLEAKGGHTYRVKGITFNRPSTVASDYTFFVLDKQTEKFLEPTSDDLLENSLSRRSQDCPVFAGELTSASGRKQPLVTLPLSGCYW